MSRLYLQLFFSMILTLTAAASVAYWLLNHPLSRPSRTELDQQLIQAGQDIIHKLESAEESTWELIVDRYLERFDYSVVWKTVDDPQLTETERTKLHRGETILIESERGEQLALILVPETDKLLGVTPRKLIQIQDPLPMEVVIAGMGALAVIGIFGLILIIPIVNRLKSLEVAAQAFGRGDWSVRADDRHPDAIGKLAGAFNAMARQIELLMQDKTSLLRDQQELLQAVAHEFRGPLSRLNFALDMAVDSDQKEFKTELSEDIREALTELKDLVTEVLRYSRLQPGAPDLEVQKIAVCHIIKEIIEQYRNIAPDIKFDGHLNPDESISINVDPNYFHRALKNLLSNAVRYAHRQIIVRMGIDKKRFWVSVEDDGIGIPPHQRRRIFEPFTRLDPSRSRNSGSTGLGLAIVKRILQKQSGEIFLDESPLGGARFRMFWPTERPS